MFGASQLWGKVGRAFFRPLSERQYSRDQGGDRSLLTPQIVRALKPEALEAAHLGRTTKAYRPANRA